MWRTNVAKMLGYVVALLGLLSGVGWVLGIDWLKNLLPPMVTAISFVPSGIILVLVAKIAAKEDCYGFSAVILPVLSLLLLLVMSTLFFSIIVDVNFGIVDIFAWGRSKQIEEMRPIKFLFPSIATIIDFTLVASAGLFGAASFCRKKSFLFAIGMFVAVIGAYALIGHITNLPLLYYYIPGKYPPVSIGTAALFVIWGLGMMFCQWGKNGTNSK